VAKKVTELFITPDDPPSKRAILIAAFDLFVKNGFDATNIREIGKEAGYSNPALFKFFASKEQLGLYLFERCYLNYTEVFGSAMHSARSFEENLDDTLDSFCETLSDDPGAFLFVQDHLRHFWPMVSTPVRRVSILGQVRSLIEQGISEKKVNKYPEPKFLVAAFVGFLTQFARMHYFGEFKGGVDAWKNQLRAVSHRMLIS
jgi:AcrR family transcriptional regulator